jgi:hypothetical protein
VACLCNARGATAVSGPRRAEEDGAAGRAATSANGGSDPIVYFAFDLPYLDGYDLRSRPRLERKRLLAELVETFLVTGHGKPFTDGGCDNWMRERCDEAGLPECTSHGLKKIAATIVAESGAADRQMMDLFDWATEKMVKTYTSAARKRTLAAEAARGLAAFTWEQDEDKSATA